MKTTPGPPAEQPSPSTLLTKSASSTMRTPAASPSRSARTWSRIRGRNSRRPKRCPTRESNDSNSTDHGSMTSILVMSGPTRDPERCHESRPGKDTNSQEQSRNEYDQEPNMGLDLRIYRSAAGVPTNRTAATTRPLRPHPG